MIRWLPLLCIASVASVAAFGQGAPQGFPQRGLPQSAPAGDTSVDPDSAQHGVARLSLMNGAVSMAHGNDGEMAGAVVNAPLVTEDRVLTGTNGRAEVQFDAFNLVRLAPATEVRMGDLQYKHYQVQVAQGLITFRVLRDNESQVEISTPTVSVHPLRQGTYRISVDAQGLTEITVRAGEAEVASPTGSEPLRAGQIMMSRGSINDPEFKTGSASAPDEWDRWNADRDRPFEAALNGDISRNVSPDIYGTENLDQYGTWTNDPTYGNVWVPNQGADWAPYQDGRWSDVDYYGWTWVSYEPWGWAPYHYGRWFRGGHGWAWYPGVYGRPYYWSPALVGFFGWGSPGFGVSFGFGFGNVGWVPLAPYEVYRPWYGNGYGRGFVSGYARGGIGYAGVRSTAIINNANIAGAYRNARFNGAVTSMRVGDFGRTGVSGATAIRASAGDISHASMFSGGGMPVAASRASRNYTSGGGGVGANAGMPRMNNNMRFFSAPSAGGARAGTGTGASGFGARGVGAGASGFTRGGAPASGSQAGGWQRFSPSTSGTPGARTGAGSFQRFNNGARVQNSAPRSQGFQGGGSQAVRISPPIVNNRAPSAGYSAPRSTAPGGGFGGTRPGFSGNGGGGGYSAPRAPNGGGFRGPSGGGHAAGGGGHGGHR